MISRWNRRRKLRKAFKTWHYRKNTMLCPAFINLEMQRICGVSKHKSITSSVVAGLIEHYEYEKS